LRLRKIWVARTRIGFFPLLLQMSSTSFETRLDLIEQQLAEWRLNKSLLDNINGYIEKDSLALEQDITCAVQNHLYNTRNDLTLYKPESFLRLLRDPFNDNYITDLDGILILTNNETIARMHYKLPVVSSDCHLALKPLDVQKRFFAKHLSSSQKQTYTQLVIVEAKHHVTLEHINNKLEQLNDIEHFLQMATQSDLTKTTTRFQQTVQAFKLDQFAPEVLLYIGGVYWDKKALDKIQLAQNNKPGNIGFLQLNGARFTVHDANTPHVVQPTQQGGKSKRCLRAKAL